ncbi:MAG TPA: hypothetical protein VE199_04875 [Nitrososphaera sp.]|nr:hypothetical protein [Nitrososphaera sp.]
MMSDVTTVGIRLMLACVHAHIAGRVMPASVVCMTQQLAADDAEYF